MSNSSGQPEKVPEPARPAQCRRCGLEATGLCVNFAEGIWWAYCEKCRPKGDLVVVAEAAMLRADGGGG